MKTNRYFSPVFVTVCIFFLVFSFVLTNEVVASAKKGEQVFQWSINQNPMSLDPPASFGNTAIQICQNLFDGLTALTNDMKVVPAIAKSWDISADGTVYTFHLRKDVRFHNGKPVTAHDFKYSWERSLWPDTGSYSTFLIGLIKGSDAVKKGETKTMSGLKVIDDHTLEVTLKNAAGYFLVLTTRWQYWVVDKDTVEKYGKNWVKAGNLVGTGAYKLEEWAEGDHITLVANPDYFGGKPAVDRVIMPIIPDVATSMLRYEAGELDAVSDLTPADVRRYSMDSKHKNELKITPILRVTWLGFNFEKGPFVKNKALREAFAYGIDRKKLVNIVFQGIGVPAYSFLPPGMPCHNPDLKPYSFDLKKAKAKLAEAGFPKGKGLEKHNIVLSVSEQRDRVAIFEFVQAQLLENLGIKAKLEIIPGKTYNSKLLGHELQLFHGGMGADYPDAQEFMEYLAMCGYKTNYGGFCNSVLDKLVIEANKEDDMSKRCANYGKAEEIFLKDVAITPLFYNAQTMVVKPYVKGFKYTPIYCVPFNQVSIAAH